MLSRFRRRKGKALGPAGPVFPQGFGGGHGGGSAPRPRQSNLIIETMEPRLLLSATVSSAALNTLHDQLHNFSLAVNIAESQDVLGHFLPGVAIGDTHNIGSLAGLSKAIDNDLAAAAQTVANETINYGHYDNTGGIFTGASGQVLASQGQTVGFTLRDAVYDIIGHSGNSISITGSLDSNHNLTLGFDVSIHDSAKFSIDFGPDAASYGLHLPSTSGTLDSTVTGKFSLTIAEATSAGTIASGATVATLPVSDFSLTPTSFSAYVHANATIDVGNSLTLGLITLTVGGTSNPVLDVQAGLSFDLAGSFDGSDLAAKTTSVTLTTPHITFDTGTDSTTSLLDIPLLLTADHAIPGIPTITVPMDLRLIGQAAEGNYHLDVSSLTTAFDAVMGANFDISNFARYSTSDLISALTTVDSYLQQIAGVSALNIPIPFAENLTVGGVLDIAAKFQADVIDPLNSVASTIGFGEGQTNAPTVTAAVAPDFSHLTAATTLHVVAHGASPATDTVDVTLAVGNTYLNKQGVATQDQTIADVVTSVNQAIAKTALSGVVSAYNVGGELSLSLVDAGHVLTSLAVLATPSLPTALGFTSAVTGTTNASKVLDGTAPLDVTNLPAKVGLNISIDDGVAGTYTTNPDNTQTFHAGHTITADITFGSTYLDGAGLRQAIASVDDLATSMNQAIASSVLAGYVKAVNVSGHIELQLTDPSSQSPAPAAAVDHQFSTITVKSPGGATVFNDLYDFGTYLGKALGLENTAAYQSAAAGVAQATELFTSLGFGFDAARQQITWSIGKSFDNLINAIVPLSTSLDFGSVGGLFLSNGELQVTSSVVLNLTVGLDFSGTYAGTFVNSATTVVDTTSTAPPANDLLMPQGSILDRLFFDHTGITATLDVAIVAVDPTHAVQIGGNLGPFAFTADATTQDPTTHLYTVSGAYVSLKASLFLNDANAVDPMDPSYISFNTLLTALQSVDTFKSLWAFNLSSGRDGLPFASLDITNLQITALGHPVSLPNQSAIAIHISMDDPADLLTLHVPHPTVSIANFSTNLSVADIVAGVQTVFNYLDSSTSVFQQPIPLINVSVDDVLSMTHQIVAALQSAANDPAGTLDIIATDVNKVLGGNYLALGLSPDQSQLQVTLSYAAPKLNETLPFNLDLQSLATFLGGDGSVLGDLVAELGTVASLGASGTIQVTASAMVSVAFTIRLSAASSPAVATNLLTSVNAGKGLRTDTAGNPDLQFSLADGKSFTFNVGALEASGGTITQLVTAINTAAHAADSALTTFAAFDAATGHITFTDTTSPATQNLASLGLGTATAVYGSGNTSTVITSNVLSGVDTTAAYSFKVNVAGVISEVDVAASAGRDAAHLAQDIRTAIAGTTVDAKALADAGVMLQGGFSPTASGSPISLAQLVTVVKDSTNHLEFIIRDSVLGKTSGSTFAAGHNTFSLSDIATAAAAPSSAFVVQSINGSHIALDLGLGSDTVTVNGSAPRVASGMLEESASNTDRFALDLTHTGITAQLGIVGSGLNFTVGIGALSANIVGGTVTFGADLGGAPGTAGTAGFHAGNGISSPALFTAGFTSSLGTSVGFSHLSTLHVFANGNAAVDVNLPVQIFGISAGAITLQINNLFANPDTASFAPRHVVASPQLDLSGFSPSSILNDPETLIAGLDQFLGLLDGGLAQQIYNLDLPLVGKVLLPVGSFFSTLHTAVIGELNSLVDDFKASHPGQPVTTQNIVTQGLQWVFDNVLHVGGHIYSYIDNIADPHVLSFFWTFDEVLVNQSVTLSSDLGIPGLGLDIAGATASLMATLHISLGFGYQASTPASAGSPAVTGGFFVYDTGFFTKGTASTALARVTVTPNNDTGLPTFNFQTSHALDLTIQIAMTTDPNINDGYIGFNLGILRMLAKPTGAGVTFTGDLLVDIGPADNTGLFYFRDFSKGNALNVQLAADLHVDLALKADLSSATLPSVQAELLFDYEYDRLLLAPKIPNGYFLSHIGDATHTADTAYVSGINQALTFEHVQVDLGSFISGFLKPILEKIHIVTGPLQPIIDFLTSPIPGISQLLGNTSLLDLAQYGVSAAQYSAAKAFVTIITEFNTLYDTVESLPSGQSIMLDFGTYAFGTGRIANPAGTIMLGSTTLDPFAGGSTKSVNIGASLSSVVDPTALTNSLNSAFGGKGIGDKLNAMGPSSYSSSGKTTSTTGGSFDLPFLHSPMAALQMLTGQIPSVDLIHFTLPTFDISFTKSVHVTFFGIPHVAEIGGDIIFNVGATIKLAFGYDTTGIIQFMSDHNPLDFFNGLYIDDTQGPQLILHASITGQLGLDLVLVKAGIGATLSAEVDFQFADFSHTGKVRLSTVIEELLTEPQNIFVVHGQLDVTIYLWVWVGIDLLFGTVTLYSDSYNLYGPQTIFSFGYDPTTSTPVSPAHLSGGDLDLNIGAHADRQETGSNISNPNQTFTVEQVGAGQVKVTSNDGTSKTYSGVTSITADLGTGDNNVTFKGGISEGVTLTGGDGNNKIDLTGVAVDPVITLGNGNNIIHAVANTTITAGTGNNTIYAADTGTTVINVGDGNNTIVGGTTSGATETVVAGDGNNVIYGGSGSATITAGNGGSGDNVIFGADGNNVITAHGLGNNIIFGHGAHDATQVSTDGTVTANTVDIVTPTLVAVNQVTGTGNSQIFGGDGNDIIFGVSGNNFISGSDHVTIDPVTHVTLTGNGGHDVIFGAGGSVSLDGHNGVVKASDLVAGGGNNTIYTGDGGSDVIGGTGNNLIYGGAGYDILLGGDGSIDGAKAGNADSLYSISSSPLGGNDSIFGYGGNDVIIGGVGTNNLDGGNGADIILGHEGVVVRDAATGSVSADAHLVRMQTVDDTTGGNVSISGGAGNDVIMAGIGNNTIDGGNGSDVILGHFGSFTAPSGLNNVTVTGEGGALAASDHDTITANQNALIMGGGGNNTITTYDSLSYGVAPAAGDSNANDATPPVSPVDRTVVVFGANGTVNFDYLRTGSLNLHSAATVEDTVGGTNSITVGNGGDYVFGGVGGNTIVSGTQAVVGTPVGDAVIIGHVGSVTVASSGIATVIGDVPGAAASGNDTIDAYGNAIIITGAGNNTVTTHDALLAGQSSFEWSETVLGGYAAATFSFSSSAGITIHTATTTPGLEDTAGSNIITVGDGNDIVIGGAGGGRITAGNGDDIILGHLGAINLDRMYAPDLVGFATPDIISFTNGQDGTEPQILPGSQLQPQVPGAGTMASELIHAGNGHDVIMGGGGNNTITAGNGDDMIFGASGAVTRDGRMGTNDWVFATTTEDALGGNNLITVGNGNDVVFGGAGANTITMGTSTLGFDPANDIVLGHSGTVHWAADRSTIDVAATNVLPSMFFNGNDSITAYQNTLIMTGGGDNTVTTHDQTSTIPSDRWTEIVIAGAATATLGMLSSGQFELITAQTTLFQEDFGGANKITVGDGKDVVIGGSGTASITAGNGNDVILGHLGALHFDRLLHPDATGNTPDVIGYGQSQDGALQGFSDEIISVGNGQDVIIAGGGNNIITTGNGGSAIFGAGGVVTRDGLHNNVVIEAHTTDELFGGDNIITTGDGDNVIFGGRGYNTITTGTPSETEVHLGNDIILGHAGRVAYSADMQFVTVTGGPTNGTPDIPSLVAEGDDIINAYSSAIIVAGAGSDQITTHDHAGPHAITEFTEVVLGNSGVIVAGHKSSGQFLLNVAAVTGPDAPFGGNDTITVGDSTNVVIDGAGATTVNAGASTVVTAGYGVVVEDPVSHTVLSATVLGSGLGFTDTITTTTQQAPVINAAGYTVSAPTGTGIPDGTTPQTVYIPNAGTPPGPVHLIAGSATLASGFGLSALAATWASTPGGPYGGITPIAAAPVITTYVLDTFTGTWHQDHVVSDALLSLDSSDDLLLDLWGDLPHEALPGLTIAA